MKKILAFDLDGTLTNSQKIITEKTMHAVMQAQMQGHTVVLASGRPTAGVLPVAHKLQLEKYGGYVLSFNGAEMIQCCTGKKIYQNPLPAEIVPELFALADRLGIGIMTYGQEGVIANSHHDEYMVLETQISHIPLNHYEHPLEKITFDVNKCLATASPAIAPEIEKRFAKEFGSRISVSRSEPFFIELVRQGVNKGNTLGRLCEFLGCAREDVIACGDGFNDVAMLEFAGIGVAMENAQEPVKKAADYITHSNEEDGIAEVIYEFVL